MKEEQIREILRSYCLLQARIAKAVCLYSTHSLLIIYLGLKKLDKYSREFFHRTSTIIKFRTKFAIKKKHFLFLVNFLSFHLILRLDILIVFQCMYLYKYSHFSVVNNSHILKENKFYRSFRSNNVLFENIYFMKSITRDLFGKFFFFETMSQGAYISRRQFKRE
jgi:hypothetical protein